MPAPRASPDSAEPPNVMLGGATGPAADLFGLGATLYFAVEGRGPFDAAEPLALEPVLDGLPAKNPGERLTTQAARAALESAAAPPSIAPPSAAPWSRYWPPRPR